MNQYEKMIGQAAIRTFGRIPNIIKAIEELSELQQALCKHIVSENDAMTVASVHEEIADVQIMLGRLLMLFDPTEVQDWKDSKLEHMAKLLGLEMEGDGDTVGAAMRRPPRETQQEYVPVICVKSGGPFVQGRMYAQIGWNNGMQIVFTDKAGDTKYVLFHNFDTEGEPGELRLPDDPDDGPWMDYIFDAEEFVPNEMRSICEGPEEPTGDALEEMRLE